jgi:hypothetical protein
LLIPAAGEQAARRGNARHVIKLPARRPNSTLVYSAMTAAVAALASAKAAGA